MINTVGIMIIAMLKAFNEDPLSDCDQVSILEQVTGRGRNKLSRCRALRFLVPAYVFLAGNKIFSGAISPSMT